MEKEGSSTTKNEHPDRELLLKHEYWWMVKPCTFYENEFSDCKSIKDRFHQYFIHGEVQECTHWNKSYDNCIKWEKEKDEKALDELISTEKERARDRLRAYHSNDVWAPRKSIPVNWNSELPESIKKGYENSFLKLKSDDIKAGLDDLNKEETRWTEGRCSVV